MCSVTLPLVTAELRCMASSLIFCSCYCFHRFRSRGMGRFGMRRRFWKIAKTVGSFALTIVTTWQALVVALATVAGFLKLKGLW